MKTDGRRRIPQYVAPSKSIVAAVILAHERTLQRPRAVTHGSVACVVESATWRLSDGEKTNDLDENQNVGPVKIPTQIGEEVLFTDAVVLIKDRDRMIESVRRGKSAVEVLAQNIPCHSLENRAALQQALTEGWEFFFAILPNGYPKFWLKDAKWLEAAQKIAVSIDKEFLRRMPGSPVKH